MQRVLRSASTIALIVVGSFSVNADAKHDDAFWPGADYDPAIPTVEDVLGYEAGEPITWHRDTIRYFEALRAAAPDRQGNHGTYQPHYGDKLRPFRRG